MIVPHEAEERVVSTTAAMAASVNKGANEKSREVHAVPDDGPKNITGNEAYDFQSYYAS